MQDQSYDKSQVNIDILCNSLMQAPVEIVALVYS